MSLVRSHVYCEIALCTLHFTTTTTTARSASVCVSVCVCVCVSLFVSLFMPTCLYISMCLCTFRLCVFVVFFFAVWACLHIFQWNFLCTLFFSPSLLSFRFVLAVDKACDANK